ncbi:MAG TPA: TetR family transcriptional regulator [Chitinophagaceae bacterium]|nr:TetR family transcriptional regulator [Chitinophagaceae bacterium]
MKKEKILDVAEQLFSEKGFEGTSIRDIAQMADVNIAMISYYFGSKEKLLEALISIRAGDTTEKLEALDRNEKLDPWSKMDLIVESNVDRLFNNHRFQNIMSRQFIQDDGLKQQIINIKIQNLEIIRSIISKGIKDKKFRKVDIELTATTLFSVISQITMSKNLYIRIFNLDPKMDEDTYYREISPRVKKHLKSLLRAHLDIKNA